MFLLHKLRGFVKFKGRGIMVAHIGKCELRDSFHIIPERLANWQKDPFDYDKLRRGRRGAYRNEIIEYCTNDCRYLLDIVKSFVKEFGFKISIGQAAIAELRKHYNVKRISEYQDGGVDGKSGLRAFFFGGRVECLAGRGHFHGDYKLYDLNSAYPKAMADYQHPIGNEYAARKGDPSSYTAFLKVSCRNFGAFVGRCSDGQTSAELERGTFFVSKFEYETALRYDLIEDVEILKCIDCNEFSNFAEFVRPLYARRLETKRQLKELAELGKIGSREYNDIKKDDIFIKLLLNNCYGKFCQNPRRFKERYITNLGERPPNDPPTHRRYGATSTQAGLPSRSFSGGWPELPSAENNEFALWERESRPWRFLNVGTGASITGATRAILLDGIQNAVDPIYCDTDSIICRDLQNVDIDASRLGAWDIEAEFDEVIIAGKKLYACRSSVEGVKDKVKSKGVAGLDWDKMQRILDDEIIEAINKGPTLSATHQQFYMKRRVRATTAAQVTRNYHERRQLLRA